MECKQHRRASNASQRLSSARDNYKFIFEIQDILLRFLLKL
jgi:hypothetical protein